MTLQDSHEFHCLLAKRGIWGKDSKLKESHLVTVGATVRGVYFCLEVEINLKELTTEGLLNQLIYLLCQYFCMFWLHKSVRIHICINLRCRFLEAVLLGFRDRAFLWDLRLPD